MAAQTATGAPDAPDGVVALDGDVVEGEVEQGRARRVEPQPRQGRGSRASCIARLFEVVQVEVRVAEGVHEVAGLQPRRLRHHVGQESIGRDVERHAEEDVGRALVELAGEPPFGDVELEQAMAGRERHLSRSAGFQALTMRRRESGLRRISSRTQRIWSTVPPSGFSQERHCLP